MPRRLLPRTGSRMTYQLLYTPPGQTDPQHPWGRPHSEHPSLAKAIEVSGHPPEDWYSAVSVPDMLFVDWTTYFDPKREYEHDEAHLELRWVISAPGVAEEFTDLVTASVTG